MRLQVILLSLFWFAISGSTAWGIVSTRSSITKFDQMANQKLYIDGMQGRITVVANSATDTGVVIEVIHTSDFMEIADTIDFYKNVVVDVFEQDGMINSITTIKNNYETNNKYAIDYLIKAPANMPIVINHTLGDINITGFSSNKSVTLEYGNLTINNLFDISNANDSLFLTYASFNSNKLNNSYISSQFSSIKIDNIKQLRLRGSFTSAQIERIATGDIRIDTSSMQINSITNLEITSNESPIKIDEVSGIIQSDMNGGKFTVGASNTSQQLNFSAENSEIELQISPTLSTYLNIDATLATIEIPELSTIKSIKDIDNIQFSGYIGNDIGTNRTINAVIKGGKFAIIQH